MLTLEVLSISSKERRITIFASASYCFISATVAARVSEVYARSHHGFQVKQAVAAYIGYCCADPCTTAQLEMQRLDNVKFGKTKTKMSDGE